MSTQFCLWILLFLGILSSVMGNKLALPAPCWEKVISYLPISDVRSLMQADRELEALIVANRQFWLHRARQFYELDPVVFARLKDHLDGVWDPDTDRNRLALRMIGADHHLTYIQNNMATDSQTTVTVDLENRILLMSVDQRNARIALHFEDGATRVYSLPDMSLLSSFAYHKLTEIVIRGPTLFIRPPFEKSPEDSMFHTEVINWRLKVDMAGLRPGRKRIGDAPLKVSDSYLLTYDCTLQQGLAYPLDDNGYKVDPRIVSFPVDMSLFDYAIKGSTVLTIMSQSGAFYFMDFALPKGEPVRKFLVACPKEFHQPTSSSSSPNGPS